MSPFISCHRLWFATLVLGLASLPARAAPPVSSEQLQNGQQQNDQRRLDEIRQQTSPTFTGGGTLAPGKAASAINIPGEATCLHAQSLRIDGTTRVAPALLEQWSHQVPVSQGCMALADINALLNEITAFYLGLGYITSRPISAQEDGNGVLVIKVMEGSVEKIQSTDPRIHTQGLFPSLTRGPLNLRDVEQASDQLNRLSSRRTTIDVQPGTEAGTSILSIKPNGQLPSKDWQLQASADNYDMAQRKGSLALSMDDMLGYNENLNLTYSRELNHSDVNNRAYSAALSVPDGYSTYSIFAFQSVYTAPLGGLDFRTVHTTEALKWAYVLHRQQHLMLTSTVEAALDEQNQTLFGYYRIPSASGSVPHLMVGLNALLIQSAYSANVNLQVDQGFGRDNAVGNPQGNYLSVAAQGGLSLRMSSTLTAQLGMQLQRSDDYVPGFKQFAIGGVLGVPGYRRTVYTGNSGTLAQAGVTLALPSVLQGAWRHQLSLTHYSGLIRSDAQSAREMLTSVGVQYAAGWGPWNGSVGWAHPLHSSNRKATDSDDWTFSVGYRY